ncbi:MAG: DEAD/DEAH box helicase [Oligoflexales bacterium]|nr:DEAD/DEAH box helicase [Oligoflexales bacterium]
MSQIDNELELNHVVYETFPELGIHENIVKAVGSVGWTKPTPVQSRCLPISLKGKDLAGFAQTGTGKTGVFLITIANHILNKPIIPRDHKIPAPRAVVLAPTRELAMQISDDAEKIFTALGLSTLAIFGGTNWDQQVENLKISPDLIVATTGRLADTVRRKAISLAECELFICDEADRMFDMGFIDEVEFFFDKIPETCQKLLFSATSNPQVEELAFKYLNQPEYIFLNEDKLTPENVEQHFIICESPNKLQVMIGLLRDHKPACTIIFTNTKLTAEWLQYKLNHNGFTSELITGNLPQSKRTSLIKKIKAGQVNCLIATDIASRGLHISGVTIVYNFDVPNEAANYVHRIGRTARAGASGKSYTLMCEVYSEYMSPIKKLLGDLPRAEWFDQKYLAIKDEAINPLAKRVVRSRDNMDEDDDAPKAQHQSQQSHQRSPSRQHKSQEKNSAPRFNNEQKSGPRGQQQHRKNVKHHEKGPAKSVHANLSSTHFKKIEEQNKFEPGFKNIIKKVFRLLFGKS